MVFSFLRRAFGPARAVVSTVSTSNPHTRPFVAASQNLEALESRTLFAVATPTNEEQYFLELINRARTAPAAEASRFRLALNEGLAANTLSASRRQPLAFNANLISAARTHSQWMITAKSFSHTGANGTNPGARMANSGYAFAAGLSNWAENLGWAGRKLVTPATVDMVDEVHRRLFVDEDVTGRGHRVNMLNGKMKEIGVGVATGNVNGFNAAMVSADFAYSNSKSFLTGVAYKDTVKVNKFYNVGEGLGGIVITAKRASDGKTFSTTTWSSGGYTLPLDPGTYTLTASGGVTTSAKSFTIAADNVKADFLPSNQLDTTAPTAKLANMRGKVSAKSRNLTITYKDDTLVDATTLGAGDIIVTNKKGFKGKVTLVSITPEGDASKITATYRLNARKGFAPGRYTVQLRPKAVMDTFGNVTKGGKLGTFAAK